MMDSNDESYSIVAQSILITALKREETKQPTWKKGIGSEDMNIQSSFWRKTLGRLLPFNAAW